MKHNLLKSIFISLILTLSAGEMWADYTWYSGDLLYYDFSAVSGGVNWHDGSNMQYDGSGGGKVKKVEFSNQVTMNNDWLVAKTGTGGWAEIKFSNPPSVNQRRFIINSNGKSASWGYLDKYIAGDNWGGIGSWSTTTKKMTNNNDGTYTINFTSITASAHEFKIVNYDTWTGAIGHSNNVSCVNGKLENNGGNIKFTPYIAGNVTITYDVSTGKTVITCPAPTITFDPEGGSGGTTTQSAPYGTTTSAITIPTKTGYTFGGYYTGDNGTGTQIIGTDGKWIKSKTNFTDANNKWIVTSNKTLYAKWTAIAETKYDVTISSGANGSVSPSGSQQVGASGISVTATPSTGYKFKEWTVTGGAKVASATAATTTVTATAQGTVTASFEEVLYKITVTSTNASYGTVSPTSVTAGIATPSVNITATPKTGYEFNGWTVTSGVGKITLSSTSATTITVTKALSAGTITANWKALPKYYLKHPFNGSNWEWKQMTIQADGTYTLDDKWNGTGANINTVNNDGGSSWIEAGKITGVPNVTNVNVTYIYNPKTGKLSIEQATSTGCYLVGSFNGWGNGIEFVRNDLNSNVATATLQLTTKDDIWFKISHDGEWYGNSGEINGSITNWTMKSGDNDCKLTPINSLSANDTKLCTYTFNYDLTTKKLSVTYPERYYYIASANKTLGGSVSEPNSILLTDKGGGVYSHTFTNLSANTNYWFKISTGVWKDNDGGKDWGFDAVNKDCCDPSIAVTSVDGDYKNIQMRLSSTYSNLTISFYEETGQICIMGESVTLYQIKSECGDNTYYSNFVENVNDIMSVYAVKDGTLTLEKLVSGVWTPLTSTTCPYTDVIVAPLAAGEKIGDINIYEGDFYIRTDMAPGGWNSYKQESHAFTNFNKYEDETFNHYWVEYTDNANVKARIANDYNNSLATELGDHIVSNANVRFSYNNKTNAFERAFLGGSTSNSEFLRLVVGSDGFANGKTFGDISNWVYEVTTKVTKGQIADVTAKHPNYNEGNPYNLRNDVTLLGSGSSDGEHTIRVIYDFKKNRMICGWLPDDVTDHDGELVIDADMLIVRVDDNDAPVINMKTVNDKISNLNRLYFVLELNKGTVVGGKKIFWFSVPFECKLKDVFGIEGYGTKWVVQRYRGDKRAEFGFRPEIETFWANMKQSNTATLEPNRGYVVSLNLKESDFKSIDIDDGDGNKETKSLLRLYFPSNATEFTLSKDNDMKVTVPEHLCEVNDPEHNRKPLDSHWNIIGVPGYQPVTVNGYTASYPEGGYYPDSEEPDDPTAEQPTNGNYAPNFLYTWNGTKDDYTVQDGSKFTYKHFYSYMVQFAGTIDWSQYTQNTPNPAAAPRRVAKKADKQYKVVLGENGANVDQTFITLSEKGNHDYSIGNDLEKIGSTSVARIYTQEGNWNLAANHLSDTTTVLPLTLSIPAEGEYTLSLEQGRYSTDALLYDSENGTYTDLSKEGYTFTAEAGVNNERFALRFGMKLPGGNATDLQQSQAQYLVRTEGQRIIIEGMAGDVRLYDMTGRVMTQQRAENYTEITVPATGVYVLQVGDQFEKMIIK